MVEAWELRLQYWLLTKIFSILPEWHQELGIYVLAFTCRRPLWNTRQAFTQNMFPTVWWKPECDILGLILLVLGKFNLQPSCLQRAVVWKDSSNPLNQSRGSKPFKISQSLASHHLWHKNSKKDMTQGQYYSVYVHIVQILKKQIKKTDKKPNLKRQSSKS